MTKKLLVLVPVLLAGCTSLLPLSEDERADFYVAPDGDDAGPGTRRQPFATLTRARDAVGKLAAAGLTRDVRVLLRGGTYYVPDGVTFGPEDSGTAEHAVTYAAYPGEVPVLIGGVRITGWTRHDGGLWQATIPQGIVPNQLFENGRRLTLAREPNEGYFTTESAVAGKPKTAFVYRAKDFDPKGWDWSEGRVFLWPTHDWFSTEKPVTVIDPKKRILQLEGEGGYDVRANNRYFIRNVLAVLDQPGECCIRLNERTLYLGPRQEPPAGQTIVAASAQHVIAVQGADGKLVRNLHFEGLDLSVAKGDIVKIRGAEDCSLRFCKIENGGSRGVLVQGHAQRITIYGNLIREHGLHGVELQGLPPGRPDVSHHNGVENNHIHHCGRLVGHGYGIRVQQSGHNRILHNHVHHMPRYATTIKGTRYQVLRKQLEGVTFENRHDFLHSRNNLFAYNHIHHVNLDSQDTGAMESWGSGRDNVYDHNLIHDVGNTRMTLQSGLYLDDATDHFIVTNNIIYGVVGAGGDQPIYAKGIGNRIENNILVVGPTNTAAIRSLEMAQERCDHHVYTRNLIVFEGAVPEPTGAFGRGVGNLHPKGTTLSWKVDLPADGDYRLWLLYAAHNDAWKYQMSGRSAFAVAGGKPVTLGNLPNTGGWGERRWSPAACATLPLKKGKQTLTWTNVQGGGLNWDAFALCTDPAWKPTGHDLDKPADGEHLVVVQTETRIQQGNVRDRRAIYDFNNWSDDRVAAADHNLFWKPGGTLTIKGGPANGSFETWRQLQGGKFDAHSAVADPQFVDLAKRDFRLKPGSPALALGFDTSAIGLKADFPARFDRE